MARGNQLAMGSLALSSCARCQGLVSEGCAKHRFTWIARQCCGYMPPRAVVMALPQSPPVVGNRVLRDSLWQLAGQEPQSELLLLQCCGCMPPSAVVAAWLQLPPHCARYCMENLSGHHLAQTCCPAHAVVRQLYGMHGAVRAGA